MKEHRKVLSGSVVGYFLCAVAFSWIALDNLQLRQSLRTSLSEAYSLMSQDEVNGQPGKVLNWYYESIYAQLPDPTAPGLLLICGAAILFISHRHKRCCAEQVVALDAPEDRRASER